MSLNPSKHAFSNPLRSAEVWLSVLAICTGLLSVAVRADGREGRPRGSSSPDRGSSYHGTAYHGTAEQLKQEIQHRYPHLIGFIDHRGSVQDRVMATSDCDLMYNPWGASYRYLCNGQSFCINKIGRFVQPIAYSNSLDDILFSFQQSCSVGRTGGRPGGAASDIARQTVRSTYPQFAQYLEPRANPQGRILAGPRCAVFANDYNDPRVCDGKTYCIAQLDGRYWGQNLSSYEFRDVVGFFQQQCLNVSTLLPSTYTRDLVNTRYPELRAYLEPYTTSEGRVLGTASCAVFANDYLHPGKCEGKMYCVARPDGSSIGVYSASADVEEVFGIFKKSCMRPRPNTMVPSVYVRSLVNTRYTQYLNYLLPYTGSEGQVLSHGDCTYFANDFMDPYKCDGKMYCVARSDGRPISGYSSSADAEEVLGMFRNLCRL